MAPTADAGATCGADVSMVGDVEPAVGLLRGSLTPQPIAARRARVFEPVPTPSSLQDQHSIASLRQPECGDGATQATAHRYCVQICCHGLPPLSSISLFTLTDRVPAPGSVPTLA